MVRHNVFSSLMSVLLGLSVSLVFAQESPDADKQIWDGTLDVGVKLRLRVVIQQETDGSQKATLFSIDQRNASFLTDTLTLNDQWLKFSIKKIRGEFEGKLNSDKTKAEGTWTQNGRSTPLTLQKLEGAAKQEPIKGTWVSRPQRPKEPFPYQSQNVKFASEASGVTLGGTLTIPEKQTHAAVVLVSGSGQQDRDESLAGHKPFLVLADHLSRNGIAVLRYDDRGIGESNGDPATATSQDFAKDTAGAITFLAEHPKLKNVKLGIIGHSEGGLIAPIVANQDQRVKFNVLLAGPGIDGGKIILSQVKAIAEKAGQPAAAIEASMKLQQELLDVVRNNSDKADLQSDFAVAIDRYVEQLPDAQKKLARDQLEAGVARLSLPWTRYFITYDPAPELSKNTCPTLALLGGKDLQVTVAANQSALQSALDENGVQGNELVVWENANHLFQAAETGMPGEYGEIQQTIMPKVLEKITSWIQAR